MTIQVTERARLHRLAVNTTGILGLGMLAMMMLACDPCSGVAQCGAADSSPYLAIDGQIVGGWGRTLRGKKVVVRLEVWEPGKDMATFAMTMPKAPLDAMYVLGLKGNIEIDHGREIELKGIWKRLQRLPRGEKLTLEQNGGTVTMWIEEPNGERTRGG